MIGLLGYNFCSDGNALDPMPTSVNNITTTTIQNGTYDHFYAGYDVTSEYSHALPTEWDFNTIMDCNFENNISAGNIDDLTSNISVSKSSGARRAHLTGQQSRKLPSPALMTCHLSSQII